MANIFFKVNKISFTDDELPEEGAGHNRALNLMVKCDGHYVKRVMVDGGSNVDVCPLSTLQSMKNNTDRIRPSNVCIRAFDGSARDTMGEINLTMTIGPVDFEIVFQVVDMVTSYNFLLGRPWIHTARAVPSTLHQMLKFEHDGFVNSCFNNMTCMRNSCADLEKLSIIEITHQEVEYVEDEVVEEIRRELEQFENKPKPNLNKTESINIGSPEEVRETKISIHIEQKTRDVLIQHLFEYRDVFAWFYDDMPGLSVDMVVHKLSTYPGFPPVQQKQQKFKIDMSDKIKEIIKQLSANVVRAIRYTTWVANVVPVLKKDGKTRFCVDYRDLNKASPKDNFPLPNIHILVDNCAKHEIQSFVDCYAGYHQILMDEDDAEKTAFTTPWVLIVTGSCHSV
ncbi:uncharacterized protein [Nicotiana sylvestris]|uniref:uncharacterized protein n=1 Tax=Nicotiana sylvestris TaxID=4096 RepID=UPI00388C951E